MYTLLISEESSYAEALTREFKQHGIRFLVTEGHPWVRDAIICLNKDGSLLVRDPRLHTSNNFLGWHPPWINDATSSSWYELSDIDWADGVCLKPWVEDTGVLVRFIENHIGLKCRYENVPLEGGNFFLVRNRDNQLVLIIGEAVITHEYSLAGQRGDIPVDPDQLKAKYAKIFNLESKNVVFIINLTWHIDLQMIVVGNAVLMHSPIKAIEFDPGQRGVYGLFLSDIQAAVEENSQSLKEAGVRVEMECLALYKPTTKNPYDLFRQPVSSFINGIAIEGKELYFTLDSPNKEHKKQFETMMLRLGYNVKYVNTCGQNAVSTQRDAAELGGGLRCSTSMLDFSLVEKMRTFFSSINLPFYRQLPPQYDIPSSVIGINLQGLGMGDWAVESFAHVLKVKPGIRWVNLSQNCFSSDGLAALFEALYVNKSLQDLDLSSNHINLIILSCILKFSSLRSLKLKGCGFNSFSLIPLMQSLATTSLFNLDLSDNDFGVGPTWVLKTLLISTSVSVINFGDNGLLGSIGDLSTLLAVRPGPKLKVLTLGNVEHINDINRPPVPKESKAFHNTMPGTRLGGDLKSIGTSPGD